MRNIGFLINSILILVYSCSDVNIEKHYYDSGEIQFIIEKNNSGERNGEYTEYYKNGNIKTISTYTNGKKGDTIKGYYDSSNLEFIQFKSKDIDSIYKYYETGELLSKGKVEDNKVSGWWDFYDKKGDKSHSIDYKFIRDTLFNNQLKVYKDKTEIVKDSSYFFNQKIPDTILVGSIYSFALEYHSNISDSSTVYFCYSKSFNEDFSNIDLVDIDTLYSGSHTIKSRIRRNEIGESNFRGFFVEKVSEVVGVNKEDSTKVDIVTQKKRIYLDRPIYVIDSLDISVSEGLL